MGVLSGEATCLYVDKWKSKYQPDYYINVKQSQLLTVSLSIQRHLHSKSGILNVFYSTMNRIFPIVLASTLLGAAHAQLSGSVGPTTSYQSKAKVKICDVTDYSDDVESDIGPALADAWGDCSDGGLVYIPPGTYDMVTCVQLKDGQSVAVQLDGIIQRSDDEDCSHMIAFRSVDDLEFFSGTSKGAIQGFGYKYLQNGEYGPRFFRFQDISNFSVHGFAAIDSASYYFVFDTVSNGEIYNIIARGLSNVGATDAFDIWGTNIHIHDIEE